MSFCVEGYLTQVCFETCSQMGADALTITVNTAVDEDLCLRLMGFFPLAQVRKNLENGVIKM